MNNSNPKIYVNVINNSRQPRIPSKKMEQVVRAVCYGEGIQSAEIGIIVLDDEQIHAMNKEFLQHDYPTDVITFLIDEAEENQPLSGEIYISADTAKLQAKEYSVSLTNELMRLAAHGALHLAGYDDSTDEERNRMHELENKYIT